jgi:hypothetical protein
VIAALAVATATLAPRDERTLTLAGGDTTFLPAGVQRGFNVTAYTPDGFSDPLAQAAIAALPPTGTTHVAFTPTWYQETTTSSAIAPDPQKTVTDASLVAGLRQARAAGLDVVVKPHVDVIDGSFRGDIRPDDYDAWFADYRVLLLRYARIAQAAGAPLLVIGDELTGVQGDTERWPPLIAAVRRVFHGRLTYAANWDPGYAAVPFWDLLDDVGIDEYHPLDTGREEPTVAQLEAAWAPVAQQLQAAHDATGKPVILTEIGYPARRGAAAAPAAEDLEQPLDASAQARAYTAAYRVLRQLPFLAGIYWWEWAADSRTDRPEAGQGGYDPRDKPAASVVRNYSG